MLRPMEYSKDGISLTESFEGCRLSAYLDGAGVLTIGYGHTRGVYRGMEITQGIADAFLRADINGAVMAVNKLVTPQLSQNEFDALVDFVFNLGPEAFKQSTLLKLINSNQFELAAKEFDKWDHCSGKVVAGLLRRREAETKLFTGVK